MTRLPAAPGMALRGRWCCRCRRGNFRVTPFPVALGCARSQAAGLGRASASREEAGWETLAAGRGSAGERAGTSARPGSSAASQGFERRARKSSSLWGKMASVMPRRRSAVPGGFPGDNAGAGQRVSFCENLVNHMFKRLPPPRPDIIIHL